MQVHPDHSYSKERVFSNNTVTSFRATSLFHPLHQCLYHTLTTEVSKGTNKEPTTILSLTSRRAVLFINALHTVTSMHSKDVVIRLDDTPLGATPDTPRTITTLPPSDTLPRLLAF